LLCMPLFLIAVIIIYEKLGISWTHYAQGDLTALLAGFIVIYFVYIPYCFVIKRSFKLFTPITLKWKWIVVLLVIFPVAVYCLYIYLPFNYQNKGLRHAIELCFVGFAAIAACASGITYFVPLHLPFPLKQNDKSISDELPEFEEPEPIQLSIDGELDLHTFQPSEVKDLIPEYLSLCRKRGILEVRIIHGKGTGTLRRTVHSILNRTPEVDSYRLAGVDSGGWGATIVRLKTNS